ncbi:MAG: hypothetical protein CL915_12860 [Deltaproteobacteria bacterium]|nr:hypothetical protein [Deltaproteobacteria bacterium]
MTKTFILCLYVSYVYHLLVFRNNPFSTKLISNKKKIEFTKKKLGLEKAILNGSEQLTSDVSPGNLNFKLVGIVSINGDCSVLIEN